MPRHPSTPDNQSGWIHLGAASTETGLLAVVAPEIAAVLGGEWTARYLDDDGNPLPEPAEPPRHELVEYEEIETGDDHVAVLVATHADGAWKVDGKFADCPGGGRELIEVRIMLWGCECTCHDEQPAELNTCPGDCHDEDPHPRPQPDWN
jgi:hypothetical protein